MELGDWVTVQSIIVVGRDNKAGLQHQHGRRENIDLVIKNTRVDLFSQIKV